MSLSKKLFILNALVITLYTKGMTSDEVKALMCTKDPHVTEVKMGCIQSISVSPNTHEQTLWSVEFSGCTALAVVATDEHDARIAILGHLLSYKSELEKAHQVSDFLQQFMGKKYTNKHVLIITPAEQEDHNLPVFSDLLYRLCLYTRTAFLQAETQIKLYDPLDDKEHNALVLQVPSTDSSQPIRYRSWLGTGTFE